MMLDEIIEEEVSDLLSEDDPCWEGYTMVGTKMQDGEEVPNCVPSDGVEDYEDDAMTEMTTTLNVPGYNTPFAFAPADDEDEEELEERLARLNRKVGYTDVSELTSPEALQDFINYFGPYMMQNQQIAEKIKSQFLRPLDEVKARTGTGGRRAMEGGKGKVFKVPNPNSRHGEGDATLLVDAIIKPNGDVEIARILGFGTGKPPSPPVEHTEHIKRMIKSGEAEEMPSIEFMAET